MLVSLELGVVGVQAPDLEGLGLGGVALYFVRLGANIPWALVFLLGCAALDVTADVGDITLRAALLQTVSEWFCMGSPPTPWGFFCTCPAVTRFF